MLGCDRRFRARVYSLCCSARRQACYRLRSRSFTSVKEVAWAKLLSCCAMVFVPLKDMSYKDIKITTLPKAPMTKSSLLRRLFACIMRSPLFDFWRYEPKPSTLSQVFKAILLKSEAVGAAGEDAWCTRRSRKCAFCCFGSGPAQFHEPNLAETQALVSDCRTTWVR